MKCPKCGKDNQDFVRYCDQCGAEIAKSSDTVLSESDQEALREGQSRYEEYGAADLAQPKSRKGLIITLIVVTLCIVVGISLFFIIRSLNQSGSKDSVHGSENPSVSSFINARQRTVQVTTRVRGVESKTVTAVDQDSKKLYTMSSYKVVDPTQLAQEGAVDSNYSAMNDMTMEAYTDLHRAVLKLTSGSNSVDGYVQLDNLRQDLAASPYGPGGTNSMMTQEQFDMAMDVYDFVYDLLQKDGDVLHLQELKDTISGDIDRCGNVTERNEQITIDGTTVNTKTVTHTFTDLSVVEAVFNDTKAWAKTNLRLGDKINSYIDSALEQVNLSQVKDTVKNLGEFKVVVKRCLNDNGELLQAELSGEFSGYKVTVRLTGDLNPQNLKKATLTISAALPGSQSEMTLQTIVIKDESTDAQDKYTATYTGMVLAGSTEYVRDTNSGDFTVTNKMTIPLASMAGSGSALGLPEGMKLPELPDLNFSISGNLKKTADSMILTYSDPSGMGDIEVVISNKAEIPELQSENNLLTMKPEEVQALFSGLGGIGRGVLFTQTEQLAA